MKISTTNFAFMSLPAYSLSRCSDNKLQKKNGYFKLLALTGVWPKDGFCHAVSAAKVRGPKFVLKGSLYNLKSGNNPNSGHPGIILVVRGLAKFQISES